MSANPYAHFEDDDELLGVNTAATQHNGAVFELRGPHGEDLPEEMQEALQKYLGYSIPVRSETVPLIFRAITGVYDFFANFADYSTQGPLLAALAEVVDDLTDGKLGEVYNLIEAERKILYTWAIEKFLIAILPEDGNWGKDLAGDASNEEVAMYFETYLDAVRFVRSKASSIYYNLCSKLNRQPDEGLVNTGIYSKRDEIRYITLNKPPVAR